MIVFERVANTSWERGVVLVLVPYVRGTAAVTEPVEATMGGVALEHLKL